MMKVSHAILASVFLVAFSTISVAQTCNGSIPESTPTSRFIINTNGTVTDTYTGLQWMRCSLGKSWTGSTCTDDDNILYTWSDALSQAENAEFATFSDWRLPNIKELYSIVETSCYGPSINSTVFPNSQISASYWSSSPDVNNLDSIWGVDFYSGSTTNSYLTGATINSVRLVRDVQ